MTQATKRTIKPQPQPMNDEQRAAAIYRSIAQRVESTAQGVLFNLASNPASQGTAPEELADYALAVAKRFIAATPKVIEEIVKGIADAETKEA